MFKKSHWIILYQCTYPANVSNRNSSNHFASVYVPCQYLIPPTWVSRLQNTDIFLFRGHHRPTHFSFKVLPLDQLQTLAERHIQTNSCHWCNGWTFGKWLEMGNVTNVQHSRFQAVGTYIICTVYKKLHIDTYCIHHVILHIILKWIMRMKQK